MSSPESSPEPPPLFQKTKKSSKHSTSAKKKAKSAAFVQDDAGKNEGTNPNWDLKPPEGAVLIKSSEDFGDFDWDRVNDDENLDVWLIRVPNTLKTKALQDLRLDIPAASSKTVQVGHLERKNTSFDIWSLGEDQIEQVGGEELKRLTCLLPRRRKGGKLYQVPRPVARHLVISAKLTLPPPESGESSTVYKNPPRPRVEPKLLTHRFMPVGSLVRGAGSQELMDVDELDQSALAASQVSAAALQSESPKKKRKVDADAPKKSKKSKTSTSS